MYVCPTASFLKYTRQNLQAWDDERTDKYTNTNNPKLNCFLTGYRYVGSACARALAVKWRPFNTVSIRDAAPSAPIPLFKAVDNKDVNKQH